MAYRNFQSRLSEAEWETLRTSVALVCRDAVRAPVEKGGDWVGVAEALSLLGRHAQTAGKDDDLALCLLEEFADDSTRQSTVARARKLVDKLPEHKLRRMTLKAAKIVDRSCPEQSFHFRATLALVATFANGDIRLR